MLFLKSFAPAAGRPAAPALRGGTEAHAERVGRPTHPVETAPRNHGGASLRPGAPRQDRGADRGDRGGRSQSRGTAGATRLFVNLGTKDGFYKASFLQFILDMSDLKKEVLGKIDMRDMNSWIEIESGAAKKMISALDGKNYKGRRIRMNDADSGGQRGSNEG